MNFGLLRLRGPSKIGQTLTLVESVVFTLEKFGSPELSDDPQERYCASQQPAADHSSPQVSGAERPQLLLHARVIFVAAVILFPVQHQMRAENAAPGYRIDLRDAREQAARAERADHP